MIFRRQPRLIEKLLIVEDEPLVAFDNEHFLGDSGYTIVATVDSVAAAVGVIAGDDEIHLVLVDISLSDGNGMAVAVAAQAKGVHVLFVTGDCPAGAREIAAGCLSKPYPQRDLLTAIGAIEDVLAGRRPKRLPPSFSLFREPA